MPTFFFPVYLLYYLIYFFNITCQFQPKCCLCFFSKNQEKKKQGILLNLPVSAHKAQPSPGGLGLNLGKVHMQIISNSLISELAVAERISAKAAQSHPKQRLHLPQVQCGLPLFLCQVPLPQSPLSLLRRCSLLLLSVVQNMS